MSKSSSSPASQRLPIDRPDDWHLRIPFKGYRHHRQEAPGDVALAVRENHHHTTPPPKQRPREVYLK